MKVGLGIDTGGTYTDAVIYDFENDRIVAAAKALTTKDNLVTGINNSIRKLPAKQLKKVSLVSLSTTLATNACVEGKGSRGKLVLMGYDIELLRRLGSRYGLPDCREIITIRGRHGQYGEIVEEPDWISLKKSVLRCKDEVDAFGVVEYWGIRNPEYEKKAKKLIREWTGLPVVCAHELSGEINSFRRAATTLLNARLIPLIDELLKAVKTSLKHNGIDAPLMIVRGDGTLMSEEFAKEKPVETLLSGPAASVVGGTKLSGCSDCIVIDMGGTTSDIAVVRRGFTVLASEGVDIGEWRTGTRAIEVKTIGLGGDSLISFDRNEEITIGPKRAIPLAQLVWKWPGIKQKLEDMYREGKKLSISLSEFFYLQSLPQKCCNLTEEEKKIVSALEAGPKSIEELATQTGTRPYFLRTERIEALGIVARSGFTPTDVMHITGVFTRWDKEASLLGGRILARRLGISLQDLVDTVKRYIEKQLYMAVSGYLLKRNCKKFATGFDRGALTIMEMGFDKPFEEIEASITTFLPVVGIGAPIDVFIEKVAASLGTRAIVPTWAEVANAVGAITGSIMGEEVVIIKPEYSIAGIEGYNCYSSANFYRVKDFEEALSWAQEEAKRLALEKARAMGAPDAKVELQVYDREAGSRHSNEKLLLQTEVVARAVGKARVVYKF